MKRFLTSSVLLASLAAACPAAATAATQFELASNGGAPEVAVDSSGNGHFVWTEGRISEADITHYCRIAPGATTCNASHTFIPTSDDPNNNTDFDGPHIFVSGSNVIVMTHRCCGGFPPAGSDATVIYISTDNGQTFGTQQVVGDANTQGNAILGPGPRLSTISDVVTGGTFYQAVSPGTFTEEDANLGDSGPSQSYSGSLALFDATTPVATFDDLETTFWRRYDGSGSYNDVANWTPTATVGPGVEGQLAYGPNGVWLLYEVGEPGNNTLVARPFFGEGFGSQVSVSETGDPIFADFFQDPTGRLHAVWLDGSRDLVYRRSDPDALTNYGPATQLAPASFEIFHIEVAAGADGEGWAVWDANSTRNTVAAVALEVAAEQPVLGESVTVDVVSGEVFIDLPGDSAAHASQKGADFIPLTEARTIPVRSVLDTRDGTVALRSARNAAGRTQSGRFSDGVFQVLQSSKRSAKGLTTLRMKGSKAAFRRCGDSSGSANAALTRRQIRRLRARARGRYRTRSRYSAATVRGTTWNVKDSCAGTVTTVKRGKVAVRDFRKKKTVVVSAGERYLAKAPE
jgi:hypothetical protein